MRIGVIGGGHGCYAAAAALAEKGHQVRLWRRDGAAFDGLRRAGALEVTDYRGTRRIDVYKRQDVARLFAQADAVEGLDAVLGVGGRQVERRRQRALLVQRVVAQVDGAGGEAVVLRVGHGKSPGIGSGGWTAPAVNACGRRGARAIRR